MPPAVNVLTKKMRQGGVARSPLADTDLIGETFARGIEDRLRPLVKTIIGANVGTTRVSKLAEAIGTLTAPAMLGLIEVEDADTPALIGMQADLAYHLIDLTLGGDPGSAPEPTTRAFTSIDMALCRLHLDAFLQAFTKAIGTVLGRPLVNALRIRDQRQNLAQLRLAPDYIDVLVFEVTLSLGEAGRKGEFLLVLPLSTLDVIRASVQERRTQSRDRPNDLWKHLMRRAAAAAPVPVDAVLYRHSFSLSALRGLQVGQVLELPRQAAEEVQLALAQPGGRPALLATGRLGAYQDHKVVKLTTPLDRRVIIHVERALHPTVVPPAAAEKVPRLPAPEEADASDQPAS